MHNEAQPLAQELIRQLNTLRAEMLQLEASGMVDSAGIHPEHRASAANLIHYLALRRHDIRQLQAQLASLGLSSLGRTESHVMGGLHAVMNVLNQLAGSSEAPADFPQSAPAIDAGAGLLEKNSEALLGTPPGRNVRIMVTMPSEAATDYDLVRDLVLRGMDCMRINWAHDGPAAWSGMVRNLRRAVKETGRPCKIAMDLAGPKLRTGPMEPGPARPIRTAAVEVPPLIAPSPPPAAAPDLGGGWARAVGRLRGRKRLASVLAEVKPVSIEGDTLMLEVANGNAFIRDTLEDADARRIIAEAVAESFERRLRLEYRFVAALAPRLEAVEPGRPAAGPPSSREHPLVREALEVFGGTIVRNGAN